MTYKAEYIRDIETTAPGVVQKLYKLSDSVEYTDSSSTDIHTTKYVIASAADLDQRPDHYMEGKEVMVFPAREDGTVITYLELYSRRNTLDHQSTLDGFLEDVSERTPNP